MSERIQIFSNTLGAAELAAVERAFESRWLGKGRECEAFEAEFLAHLGGQGHVLMTDCCTSAIYVGLRALGIGPGDEVIVPTVHFVAAANAVLEQGARVIFADVDDHTLNLTAQEIERLRTPKTRAVFLLHYGGHPARMDELNDAADGLLVVEDAANAIVSTYRGQACGTLSAMGVWSFDAMKILVTIDGGALWVRDGEIAERAKMLRYLGLLPEQMSGTEAQKAGRGRWWQFEIGAPSGRFISNDVHAAIGRIQLRRLRGFIERRAEIWRAYQRGLSDVGDLILPPEPLPGCTTSYYLYWVKTARRDELANYLADQGIYTTFRYYPLHLVRYYGSNARLPNAEKAARETLCLPMHQNLSDENVGQVVDAVRRFYGAG